MFVQVTCVVAESRLGGDHDWKRLRAPQCACKVCMQTASRSDVVDLEGQAAQFKRQASGLLRHCVWCLLWCGFLFLCPVLTIW